MSQNFLDGTLTLVQVWSYINSGKRKKNHLNKIDVVSWFIKL